MNELALGLIAGSTHVWLGPDHLAAVAPWAASQRQRFWTVGMEWATGHCLGAAVVALAALFMREIISPDMMSAWGEQAVGVLLVAIGVRGCRSALSAQPRGCLVHGHMGRGHAFQPMLAGPAPATEPDRRFRPALAVGLLHGVAGGSHLLGILPALAFPTTLQSLAYLGGFIAGTVVAMVLFSGIAAAAARWSRRKGIGAHRVLVGATSVATAGLGLFWMVHV